MVHAGTVVRELIRRNPVTLHVGSVRMAARTRFGDIERVDLGARIAGRSQSMHAMAINANRDFRVALGKKLSVHAGFVLAQLIRPQGWVVLAHESRIGMAAPAKFRDLTPQDLAAEARRFAHGVHVGLGGIAAVTARARQTLLGVNVARELLFGDLKRRIEPTMAVKTSVLRLSRNNACRRTHHKQKEQRS